jgi:hypothetical protein
MRFAVSPANIKYGSVILGMDEIAMLEERRTLYDNKGNGILFEIS